MVIVRQLNDDLTAPIGDTRTRELARTLRALLDAPAT
jgi:hypothetical protein